MADTRAQRWLQEAVKSSTDAKGFYSAPREVLFTITDHLPANSKVALALAGKFFFTSLYPDGIRITELENKEDRLCLLLLLEQDAQDLYLCFGCKRLRPRGPKHHQHQQRSHPGCGPDFQVTPQRDFDFERHMKQHYELCPKLEDRAPRWAMRSNPLTWRPYPHPVGPQSPEIKKEKWPEITFTQAYRVMQRHRLGKPYGLPIDSLEKRFGFERYLSPGDKTKSHFPLEQHIRHPSTIGNEPIRQHPASTKTWHFIHEYSARIRHHQLGIRRSHQIRGPSCSVADLSKVIDELELPICAHIFASAFTPASGVFPDHNSCVRELHALWLAGRDPRLNAYSDQGGAYCTTCRTGYFIKIRNGEGGNGWVVNLDSYHNLGGCRDPDDRWWNCLTHTSFSHFYKSVSVAEPPCVVYDWHGKRVTIPRRWTSSYPDMLVMFFTQSPERERWALLKIVHHDHCLTPCPGGSHLLIPRTELAEDMTYRVPLCTAPRTRHSPNRA